MVSRMAKPEEVLVVENDQGEVVREFMKDTDSINLYKNMRETLGKNTHAHTHTHNHTFYTRLILNPFHHCWFVFSWLQWIQF